MNNYDKFLIKAFHDIATGHGWKQRSPEGLVVPYFITEFNRCLEHAELNRALGIQFSRQTQQGWFEIAPACRTNDMRKVESGWHSTVFEILASVGFYAPENGNDGRIQVTNDTIDFLVHRLGLDIKRLRITYFGGGEVVPGIILKPDDVWRKAWLEAGIVKKNILAVRGPKNFALFVGKGERAGPKCEIMYFHGNGAKARWVELGTLIMDEVRFVGGGEKPWKTTPALTVVAGAAFGLERTAAAYSRCPDLTKLSPLKTMLKIVLAYSGQSATTRELIRGDMLVLVDQVRACVFILAAGKLTTESPLGTLLQTMARRIRRKIAILCIKDSQCFVSELESEVVKHYSSRYPKLSGNRGSLLKLVNTVTWPEGWSPESYSPAK